MDNEIQNLKTNEDNLKSKASQQHDYKNAELRRSEDEKNPELKGDDGKLLKTHTVCLNTAAGGNCGNAPAASLVPCLGAAKNAKAKVPPICCGKVGALLKTSPKCLCAAILSPIAKNAGANPAVAVTIPKRCNIKNRPIGKKCGMNKVVQQEQEEKEIEV
ncbi:hypothetical protein MTR67_017850 [Solanum verrucosum]|uniref:Bifunctional inhibitor/plant lipid transfer protein/seed storage helical domain-containing protein n=1 Tax=Solanum verrucosum TaxID=315347 RepID=A0AAF0QNQ2_SOLVR|nr:hypothetical protein MTR67_017850 [Solanum verrucosum]